MVLADVFEGFEEGRAETVVSAGEVAGEGGLDLGLGDGIWGRGRLVRAPRHLAGGRGEGGGDVEEDYVGGGRAVEECEECGRCRRGERGGEDWRGGGSLHCRVRTGGGGSAMQVRASEVQGPASIYMLRRREPHAYLQNRRR